MAKAPDPKALAAAQAKAKALEDAQKLREARAKLVVWVGLGDEVRTLRYNDVSADHVARMTAAGLTEASLWQELLTTTLTPLTSIVAAWWLAGMQAGVVEEYEKLGAITYGDGPWIRLLDDDEIAAVDAGEADLDPLDCDAG